MNTDVKDYFLCLMGKIKAFICQKIESDFIRKVAETLATRTALIGAGFITGILIARILGPEGRGIYAVALALATTGVQLCNLGLHASNTYSVSRDPKLLPILVGNTLVISFVGGGFTAGFAWVVFSMWPTIAPIRGLLLGMALVWIPLGLVYLLLQSILLGIHEVRAYNTIELITQLSSIVLLSLLLAFKSVTVVTVFAMGFVTVGLSVIWTYFRIVPHLSRKPVVSLALFADNIRYGVKAYASALFSFLVLRVDLLMVKYILDAKHAGYYSVAVNMADMMLMLPTVTGTILFPKLSALPRAEEKWLFAKKTSIGMGILMLVISACASYIAGPIVRLLLGEEFTPAVPAFIWLTPGIIMLSINIIYMNYFASIGMPPITLYAPCVAALLNITLNLKLIPLLGIVGASLSSVVAYGLMLFMSLMCIWRRSNDI